MNPHDTYARTHMGPQPDPPSENAAISSNDGTPQRSSTSPVPHLSQTLAGRSREASASIAGIYYQALVTLDVILHLSSDKAVVIEGREDIDIELVSPNLGQQPIRVEGKQVKHTGAESLAWSDDEVKLSVIEFFLEFCATPRNQHCLFSLTTPARLVPENAKQQHGIIGKWIAFCKSPQSQPGFIKDLRMRFIALAKRSDLSESLRNQISRSATECSDEDLTDFAHRVIWEGRHPGFNQLWSAILATLKASHSHHGIPEDIAAHLLASRILQLAAQGDMGQRRISATFPAETLANAQQSLTIQKMAAERPYLLGILNAITSSSNEVRSDIAELKNSMDEQLAAQSAQIRDFRQDFSDAQRLKSSFGSDSGQPTRDPFPLGESLMGSAPAEPAILAAIHAGEFSKAVALCDPLIRRTIGTEKANYLYLQACAYSGFDLTRASEAADEAAQSLAGTGWDVILRGLSEILSHVRPSSEPISAVIDPTQDESLRKAGHLILAEIAQHDDDYDAMLKYAKGFGGDPRFIKTCIRANIGKENFDVASELMETVFRNTEPEFLRLRAHISLRRLSKAMSKPGLRSLPADFIARCKDIIREHQAAIEVCAREAKYRRVELLVNCGLLHQWVQDHVGAEPYFRKAVALTPDIPEAHFSLAQNLFISGRIPEALSHARAADLAGRRSSFAKPQANARLLIATIALRGGCPHSEGHQACQAIIATASLPADYHGRARTARVRIAASEENIPDITALLDAWPGSERDEQYHLACMIRSEVDRDALAAINEYKIIESMTSLDVGVLHEARLLATAAYFNAQQFVEAVAVGREALSMGLGSTGAEMVLYALKRSGEHQQMQELEDLILAERPNHVMTLQMRASRLFESGDLAACCTVAVKIAEVTHRVRDAHWAASILWTLGRVEDAARIFLPHEAALAEEEQLLLASELRAARGDWRSSLVLALSAHERDKASSRAARFAFNRLQQLDSRHIDVSDLTERIELFLRTVKSTPYADPVLMVLPSDPQEIRELIQRHQVELSRVASLYEGHQLSVEWLAMQHRQGAVQSAFDILSSESLHFHSGPAINYSEADATSAFAKIQRLYLDPASMILASCSGLFPILRQRARLYVIAQHVLELRALIELVHDDIVSAENGHRPNLSPHELGALRTRLQHLRHVQDDVDRFVEIYQPKAISGVDPEEYPVLIGSRDLHGAASVEHSGSYVLSLLPLRRASTSIPFNIMLTLLKESDSVKIDEYCAVVRRCIWMGVRWIGVSFACFSQALMTDGGRIGIHSRTVLGAFRECNWNRDLLALNMLNYLCVCAIRARSIPENSPPMLAVVAVLFGRSFDKKQRRKYLRKMESLLCRSFSRRLQPPVLKEISSALAHIRSRIRHGDPYRDDQLMPNRHRLYGSKPGNRWMDEFDQIKASDTLRL